MRTKLAFVGLGLWAAAVASSTVSCGGSDDDKNSGGSAGVGIVIDGGSGTGGTGGAGGVSGTGGSGGSAGSTSRLGAACAADTDCGTGLMCATASSGIFGNKGPAGGYCTADCSGDAGTCQQFGENAVCLNFGDTVDALFCVQGCTFGPEGAARPPTKCRGRDEVACGPLFGRTGTMCATDSNCGQGEICDPEQGCFQVIPACLPQCNADSDCGTGLYCDPQDGLCSSTPKAGKELGSLCTQPVGTAPDECRGTCIGLVATAGGEPLTHLCAESCTIGAFPSCGWAGPASGTPAPGVCFFSSTIINERGGPGGGDRGSCAKLCNCNADCAALNPDLICADLGDAQTKQVTRRNGFCTLPQEDDGGLNPGIANCTGDGGTADSGMPPRDSGGG